MIEKALGALVLMLVLVGGGYWWGDSAATNRIAAKSLAAERIQVAAKEKKDIQVRGAEEKSAIDLVANSTIYQKGLSNEFTTQAAVTAGIHSGALRLSVPARVPSSCAPGAPAASSSGRDGEARAELSVEGAEFLTGLLTEANVVVRQLTACQADLEQDRRTVNQEPTE
jgi:prophage endopeptidase